MAQSRTALTVKYLAVDLVGSFLYFPIWWYTAGTVRAGSFCARTVLNMSRSFGLSIWVKNLFTPMFGQYDFASRLISFFMRLVTIIFYSVVLLVMSVVMALLFVAWLLFPLAVAYMFFSHLVGLLAPDKT
jgi:hypothetical protein